MEDHTEKIKEQSAAADHQFVKMTQTPVNKLVSSLALPSVISMLITMIYNTADTYFVSKIDLSASGATGVVFSLMAILQAFGFMFGHGSGSCISRHLGAKDVDTARKYASTGFFLALASGFIIMAAGLIFLTPFMKFLGSTPTILPYAKKYGMFILIAGPAMTTGCVMNNILRYEGMASLAMFGLTTGGILNIILDPIFIFSLNMGISGAGLATAVSQYVSMVLLFIMFVIGKTQSRISLKYVTLKFSLIREIIYTGAPSLARQGLNSISNMVLNNQAMIYGDACIAAMSVVAKVSNLMFSVCVGIGQGFQPVCAFNYGAKKYSRVRSGIKFTWIFSSIVMAVLASGCFILSPSIVALFRKETEVIDIGNAALRFMCVGLLLLPTVMIANMTFQSIGKTGRAFFLAMTQNGLFFIPLLLILPKLMGTTGIELSQPLAFTLAGLIALPFILSFMKKMRTVSDSPLLNN